MEQYIQLKTIERTKKGESSRREREYAQEGEVDLGAGSCSSWDLEREERLEKRLERGRALIRQVGEVGEHGGDDGGGGLLTVTRGARAPGLRAVLVGVLASGE